jgi:hypothetical protein
MFQGKRDRNRSAPGVPKDLGARNADLLQRALNEIGLRLGRPDSPARARAVSKSRSIERNDAMLLRRHRDEAARCEILNHASIAMQQNEWFAGAVIHIVKPHAIDLYELPRRRVIALGFPRERTIHQRSYAKDDSGGGNGRRKSGYRGRTTRTRKAQIHRKFLFGIA